MSRSPAAPLRVAVVGCGAVTQSNLMPVLAGHDGIEVVALVDRSRERAAQLAQAYGVGRVETDMDAVLDDVDGVILATPPAHHAPATRAAAAKGKHIFVEKPMAVTAADAQSMVDAAEASGVTLAVGLYRRLLPSVKLLRDLVARREFGAVLSVDAEEGGPYGWQLASLDGLTRTAGGGGVLIDIGSHVIDVVLHVVPGVPAFVGASDNARGGIETDSEVRFTIDHAGRAVPVRVELSRTRELRGSIQVVCDQATLELMRGDFTRLLVHPRKPDGSSSPAVRYFAEWSGQGEYLGYQAFRDEVDDWVSAIQTGTAPMLSGQSVVPVVRLIEDSYLHPAPQAEPWTDEGLASPATTVTVSSPRRRVLITGAGGFLGGRATEILSQRYGWDVVPLVHAPKSAARLARWPLAIALGDISSAADMDRVLPGCDAVVHCAVGTVWPPEAARKITVDGTRTVAEAALRANVRRFVHISTISVHRRDGTDVLNEQTPLDPPADDEYGQAKLAAEQALEAVAKQGLSTIVLRPARIYGPFSRTFTIRPLQAMAEGRFALRGDPNVPANMVYVDNVVEAIARAVEAGDHLSGNAYLVGDGEQVTISEFFQTFADLVHQRVRVLPPLPQNSDGGSTPGMAARWAGGLRSIATSPELRSMVRRVLSTDPIGTLPRRLWDASPTMQQRLLKRFGADAAMIYRPAPPASSEDLVYYSEPARVSIARARSELGFEPPVSLDRAIALTIDWSRCARLLPATRFAVPEPADQSAVAR